MSEKGDGKVTRSYRSFDPLTKSIRTSVITTLADKLNDHIKERNSAGHPNAAQGFVQQLLTGASERCSSLDITRDDINNEARRKRPKKAKKVSISPSSSKQAPSSLPMVLPRLILVSS